MSDSTYPQPAPPTGDGSPRPPSATVDTPVTVTFFANQAAGTKHEETLTLLELAERIQHTHAASKEDLPWLKLARFGDHRSKGNSLRNNDNVIAITGIEADYDQKLINLDTAKIALAGAGIAGIIYPSPSYTPKAPKWRILCILSHEYPPAERERFLARLNGLFGGVFSRESFVISQSYYFGRVNNPDHEAVVFPGTCIDLADHLDAEAIGLEKERNVGRPAQPKAKPEDITEARVRGMIEALLDNIRAAGDGEKHFTLRNNCRVLGGYLHLTDWSKEEMAEQALKALPSADDWDQARETALWAIERGLEDPLELEERPNPHPGDPTKDPNYAASQDNQAVAEHAPRRKPNSEGGDGATAQPQPAPKPKPDPAEQSLPEEPPPHNEDDAFVLPIAFSENALSYLFSDQHADNLVYIHERGQWRRYEAGRWREDHTVTVYDAARELCARAGETALMTERAGKKIAAIINKASCVSAIERLARHHHRHVRDDETFDANPMLFNGPAKSNPLTTKPQKEAT